MAGERAVSDYPTSEPWVPELPPQDLVDVTPYPKEAALARPARKPTRPSERRQAQMRAAKQGHCRLCGKPGTNLHHVIPRSRGLAAWSESNLVPLCGSGTTGCHGLIEAHDRAACQRLAERLTDAEYAYVIEAAGEGFLERRYGIRYVNAAEVSR